MSIFARKDTKPKFQLGKPKRKDTESQDFRADKVYNIGGRYFKWLTVKEIYRHDGLLDFEDWNGNTITVTEHNQEAKALVRERAKYLQQAAKETRVRDMNYWEDHYDKRGKKDKGKR